jgi:hypothetical protein
VADDVAVAEPDHGDFDPVGDLGKAGEAVEEIALIGVAGHHQPGRGIVRSRATTCSNSSVEKFYTILPPLSVEPGKTANRDRDGSKRGVVKFYKSSSEV